MTIGMKQYFYLDSANFSTICNSGLTNVHDTVNFFVGRGVFVCVVEMGMAPCAVQSGAYFFPLFSARIVHSLALFFTVAPRLPLYNNFFLVLYLCT